MRFGVGVSVDLIKRINELHDLVCCDGQFHPKGNCSTVWYSEVHICSVQCSERPYIFLQTM